MDSSDYFNSDIYQTFFKSISSSVYDNSKETSKFKNSVVDFIPMDTESLWLKNQKNIDDSNTINYYLKNPIKYKINNHGYRTNYEFKKGDHVNVFLGCSHTFGIGHHLENTWSYKVNEYVGGNFVNLSLGGSSIESQFRHLIRWLDYFKIDNIFHYQPIYSREELLYDNAIFSFSAAEMPPLLNSKHTNFFKHSIVSTPHIFRKYFTNIMAIENISNRIGANYYFNHKHPPESTNIDDIQARDFAHYSVDNQDELSKVFIEKIKNNDTSVSMSDKFQTNYF